MFNGKKAKNDTSLLVDLETSFLRLQKSYQCCLFSKLNLKELSCHLKHEPTSLHLLTELLNNECEIASEIEMHQNRN